MSKSENKTLPTETSVEDFLSSIENEKSRKCTKEEADAYEDSLKSYRDLKNSLDTAFEEGIEQGIEKVAMNGIRQGKSKVEDL